MNNNRKKQRWQLASPSYLKKALVINAFSFLNRWYFSYSLSHNLLDLIVHDRKFHLYVSIYLLYKYEETLL